MFRKAYNILSSFLGESKQGGYSSSNDQYQFDCPRCAEQNGGKPDGKKNLEVNFKIGKCHCWKCEYKGTVNRLIKRFGNGSLLNDYISEIKSIIQRGMYRLDFLKELASTIEEDDIHLPKTFTPIGDIEHLRSKKLYNYLKERHITQEIVDKFQLGYTKWDGEDMMFRSRLIIPSYDKSGNLTYWTGRDFTGYEKAVKYRNVKADRKKIVFNEGLIEWDGDIVLVEGIIDSIVAPNCIPLMGKQLLKDSELYSKLMNNAKANVIICLDADTTIDETKRIYRLLNMGKLKGKVKYIRLDKYKDFGDIFVAEGKEGIIKTLQTAKQFTEFELIF